MQRRREKKTPQPLSCGWGLHSRAMASGSQRLSLTFVWGMGSVFFILPIISVRADGKVFALESKNNSQGLDLAEAEKACIDLNARLATAEELKRAVLDCSFTGCTMGWLADGSAGTIICRKTGSKQQSLKAIDVKIETDPFVNDQYDAFCVTDEDKPCGDPPSFPHTILHGHTGFDMGDELLYVCAQGYVMGNKEAAFTLLCDTCGEWYGQVQACVKDETEAHIDYEDNFPDDRLIRIVQNEHANDKEEIEQEQEQPSFSKNSEERRTVSTRGVTQDTDTSEKGSRVPTESPVSLLSQKKMFWFPLEAFSEPESEKETDDSTKVQFSEGDNHIGVKTVYDEPGAKIFYDSEDFPVGRILTTNDTKAEIDRVAITDESWLDGYPVTQQVVEDDEEEGDKVDGSMGTEEDIVLTTDQPNHVEVRKLGTGSPVPEEGLTQIVAATMRTDDEGAKETPVPPTSVSSLEDLSMSRGYDDAAWDHPTTSLETVTQEPSTMMLLDISSLKTSMSETSMMVSPFDHTTYEEAKGTTPYPTQVATMAPAPNIITDTSPQELAEQENLTQGFGENPVPTSEPCEGEDCPKSSKGAIIAVIVILLCLLLVAAVLAVCFFKKQQQKNSVYKLNGRCQPRHHCYHHYHHQHIEMQKV
ncbi:sushi domain-containing protein 5 isoform X1 [Oxyura jamaicensis]|uniref:sushi domain-containing protein 5 isoform X1 n=1 Tax=Oxyura jamaicensis TaxID=8884 RepID=UPI0015A68F22|nr:sushi domain-containing protein 5 isoform X1 [Oxyura jamaicensis]